MLTPTSYQIFRKAPFKERRHITNKEKYKSLSNLCIPSKLMKTLVEDTIKKHVMEDFRWSRKKQWAYHKGHSTELLLIKLTEEWKSELGKGNCVATAFIDFHKAFDFIPHHVLLKKLQAFGIAGEIHHWIENYLKKRKQYTQVNG